MTKIRIAATNGLVSVLSANAAAEKPNMLIVLVDDHAFEAIFAYGSYLKDYIKTPNIDRIANEGMRSDNMTSSTSICSPCRAAVLTGKYGHKYNVTANNKGINESSPQYPVQLQKAG